ncbi:hypothetical protein FRACYDRAFT_244812 [Fragilariopsis cylindrus CCMP1102]|uniref:Uncharacterized protein n=1 Tax=Fragilariopsis cylindrus CCMP1102 TaxID=635003 RepID=A0A1E7F0P5_9STRA|nr:hypothetical protein FRACYDRAFT_244812 [Fragilariopsis cylindrus CCMP1102]|eukprot:OEU11689.1 hypothetical protein FRACYDRAFT_244812 [Fragilariopsis cylindrus CCMP1102]
MARTDRQRKQASRAHQKEEMGVDAFNEMNNAANRRHYNSITKKKAVTKGGLSQTSAAIRKRKDRAKRDATFGKGTVQKERHDEDANQKKRTVLFSKNQSPDTANKWEEDALDVIKDRRKKGQEVGAKESNALALGSDALALASKVAAPGSDVVALGSDSVALLSSSKPRSDVVALLSSMQTTMQSTATSLQSTVNVAHEYKDLAQGYKDDRNKQESITEELETKLIDSAQIVRRNSPSDFDSQDGTTERSDRTANSSVRKTVATNISKTGRKTKKVLSKILSKIITKKRSSALPTIQETNNNNRTVNNEEVDHSDISKAIGYVNVHGDNGEGDDDFSDDEGDYDLDDQDDLDEDEDYHNHDGRDIKFNNDESDDDVSMLSVRSVRSSYSMVSQHATVNLFVRGIQPEQIRKCLQNGEDIGQDNKSKHHDSTRISDSNTILCVKTDSYRASLDGKTPVKIKSGWKTNSQRIGFEHDSFSDDNIPDAQDTEGRAYLVNGARVTARYLKGLEQEKEKDKKKIKRLTTELANFRANSSNNRNNNHSNGRNDDNSYTGSRDCSYYGPNQTSDDNSYTGDRDCSYYGPNQTSDDNSSNGNRDCSPYGPNQTSAAVYSPSSTASNNNRPPLGVGSKRQRSSNDGYDDEHRNGPDSHDSRQQQPQSKRFRSSGDGGFYK